MIYRQDIWALEEEQAWHPITDAYAKAITALKTRAANDPTSWQYQAAVHAVPQGQQGDTFRDQCQHDSWFFLPWHRMYLHWFERIVRAVVAGLGDVSDEVKQSWALPYWNYGRGGSYAALPDAFREPKRNGADNPLFIPQRAAGINEGYALPDEVISAQLALAKHTFSVATTVGESAGFGGPVTQWHHNPNGLPFGALEHTPHNDVHSSVGGDGGFMSAFDTAPLDPVFWMHHANIDRLWTVWLQDASHSNPSDPNWLGMSFAFHDEHGAGVQMIPSDVLDTATNLGYSYGGPPATPTAAAAAASEPPAPTGPPPQPVPPTPPPSHPAELIGATDSLVLEGDPKTIGMDLTEPQSPGVLATSAPQRSVYLNVEGIRGKRNPGISYGVYLNLRPKGGAAESFHVGNVGFFGIERTEDTTRDHNGGHGLHHAFNITDLVTTGQGRGLWNTANVSVTFKPLRLKARGGAQAAPKQSGHTPITVGRVSLFVR
jgi:tyrosinase